MGANFKPALPPSSITHGILIPMDKPVGNSYFMNPTWEIDTMEYICKIHETLQSCSPLLAHFFSETFIFTEDKAVRMNA